MPKSLPMRVLPVALYSATTEAETVRFNLINLINLATNNRIKLKTVMPAPAKRSRAATS